MTLVWGRPLVDGGAVVTGELADLAVDQCPLLEGRFTLIAPDDYRGDTLDVKLFDRRGGELAHESLYAEDDEEDEDVRRNKHDLFRESVRLEGGRGRGKRKKNSAVGYAWSCSIWRQATVSHARTFGVHRSTLRWKAQVDRQPSRCSARERRRPDAQPVAGRGGAHRRPLGHPVWGRADRRDARPR